MAVEYSPRDIHIERVAELVPSQLEDLVAESETKGFQFLRRLVDDWASGDNRFSQPGEALFVAKRGSLIVGVGGLNIDPYGGSAVTGRVRRFYVSAKFRRRGVGSQLIDAIVSFARPRFTTLRLFTSSPVAADFYSSKGFTPCDEAPHCSHFLDFKSKLT